MVAECAELGGHGVVGVRLTIGQFPAGGLEFKAIGTAVHAPGAPPLRQPVHLRPVRPGLRQAGAQRLDAGRARPRHHDRGQARRLADGRADPLERGQRRGQRLDRAGQRRPPRRPAAAARPTSSGSAPRAWSSPSMDHAGPRARVPRPGGRPRSHRRGGQHRHRDRPVQEQSPERNQQSPLAIMSLDPQRRQAARVDIGQNRR